MTTAVVVQSRMSSTRLPGKVLAPVLGKPLMQFQLERLKRCRRVDRFVVATTTNATDDDVATLALRMGWEVTRGSESDVLDRYWQAARQVGADLVVRVTADCPLIDPAYVDEGIRQYFALGQPDYLAALGMADGTGFELVGRRLLETMAWEAREPLDREHVTRYAVHRPERFTLKGYEVTPDRALERWTVDTAADLDVVTRILTALYPRNPEFTLDDIAALMDAHPQWRDINRADNQRYAQVNSDLYQLLRDGTGMPWPAS